MGFITAIQPQYIRQPSQSSYVQVIKSHIQAEVQGIKDAWQDARLAQPLTCIGRKVGLTVAGTSVAAAAAAVANRTVIPQLVQLSYAGHQQMDLLGRLPWVGAPLSFLFGGGSILASVSTAAVTLGITKALVRCDGPIETASYWVLAHAAVGVALAPLALPSVAASVPVLGTAGCAALAISHALSSRLLTGHTTYSGVLLGVLGGLALGPMGARMAMGVSSDVAVGAAWLFGAFAGLGIAASWLSNAYALLRTDKTPDLDSMRATSDPGHILSCDRRPATVTGTKASLLDAVRAWRVSVVERAYSSSAANIGVPFCIFHGTAGSGKTATVHGVANYLNVPIYAVKVDYLDDGDMPSAKLREIFRQAHLKTQQIHRPVILFFDEAEVLFGDRRALTHGKRDAREANKLVNTFNDLIQGIDTNDDKNIIVIMATNDASQVDDSIHSRAMITEEFAPPTNADLQFMLNNMFATHLASLSRVEPGWTQVQLTKMELEAWLAPRGAKPLSGRDISIVVEHAVSQILLAYCDAKAAKSVCDNTWFQRTCREQLDAAVAYRVDAQNRVHGQRDVHVATQPEASATAGARRGQA